MPKFDPDQTILALREGQRVFGRYELRAFAGRGGMGVVWRAWDEKLERDVALKFLPDQVRTDAEAVRDLKRETKRCLELTHPHVVRVYDFVEDADAAAIAMEFVDGESLASRKVAAPGGCLGAAELAPLVAQLCAALHYAHAEVRIAHRDLKPANLLVTRDGRLKVTDFGIARSLTETRTRLTGRLAAGTSGTLCYMSPQQLAGDAPSAADDLYALGATLYELLAGKPPFYRGDGFALMKQVAERAPAPLAPHRAEAGCDGPPIPRAWEETILACLAKDAAQRPRSALEVASRLGLAAPATLTPVERAPAPDPDATIRVGVPQKDWVAEPLSSAVLQSALEKENADERGLKHRATPNHRNRWLAIAAAFALLTAGAGYYFGVVAPGQTQREEAERVAAGKKRTADLAASQQRAQEAERQRLDKEKADALAKTKADEEQRAYAVIVTRIESVFDGAPRAQFDAAESAVQAYLAGAPERFKPDVTGAWAKRKAGWDAARLAAARGGLIVRTEPAGAEVTVGALAHGTSPLTVKDAKLGKYPVTVRLADYEDERREVEVKENEFATLDVPLVRSTGALSVASNPPGLGVDVGRGLPGAPRLTGDDPPYHQIVLTPAKLEKLPTGDYELTFHRDGWPEQKQTHTVKRNETASALAEFLGGTLSITSTPSGAEVYGDGKLVGLTPLRFDDVPPGTFAFEFRLKGYKAGSARGEVRAKETAQASAVLEKTRGAELGRSWKIPEPDLEMVWIRAGNFMMGDAPARLTSAERLAPPASLGFASVRRVAAADRAIERPTQTRVTLTHGFWLGKTEVTQAQWQAVMGNNPSHFEGENFPVETVSWHEAMEFCRKLTERERAADRLPEGYVYTLPTEAQWEYACRGGTTGDFAMLFEDDIFDDAEMRLVCAQAIGAADLDERLTDKAWYYGNSRGQTHTVATKHPNPWGLHDMHGNVWEWCFDLHADRLPNGSVTDYAGPASSVRRVSRGGGWSDIARDCRSGSRLGWEPGTRHNNLGFRLALAPSP